MYQARIIDWYPKHGFMFHEDEIIETGNSVNDIKKKFENNDNILIRKIKDDGHFYIDFYYEISYDEGDGYIEDYCYMYSVYGIIEKAV